MRDMRAESYVQPMHGLERPLPPRRALRPPKMAVLGVAGGAVLMFGLSLVRTSDLRFLETSGSAEAAEIVPVAEPVERVVDARAPAETAEAPETEVTETVTTEAARAEVEVQPVAAESPPEPAPVETPEPAATPQRVSTAPEQPAAEAEPVIQVPEAAIQPEPLAIEVPQIETAAAAG